MMSPNLNYDEIKSCYDADNDIGSVAYNHNINSNLIKILILGLQFHKQNL